MKKQNVVWTVIMSGLLVFLSGCGKDDSTAPQPADGWVDLGLPSGLLWATCNLGANSPEEYGDYYAWGETTAKSTYNWSTYAYGSSDYQLTKYCTNSENGLNGFVDSLTTLQTMDDAVTQALGNGARTPTKEEWEELIDNTTSEWTSMNGVYGCRFTASNGAVLFLPTAGGRTNEHLNHAASMGVYWTATLNGDSPYFAWYFNFYLSLRGMGCFSARRFIGQSIRPVRSALDTSSTLKQ